MSFDMNSPRLNPSANCTQKPDLAKRAAAQQKFEEEKAAAISAAQGNTGLLSQINAITPKKGAIEELEALIVQASSQQSPQPSRTIGMA